MFIVSDVMYCWFSVVVCLVKVLGSRKIGLMVFSLLYIGIGCGWVCVMCNSVWLLVCELVKLIVWICGFVISVLVVLLFVRMSENMFFGSLYWVIVV